MTIFGLTVAEILSALAIIGTIYGIVAQRRNRTSDAYSVMLAALKTSGQTIDDLMKMISDLPNMRNDLSDALNEIDELKREREEWKIGIGLLLGQLVEAKIKPTWTPRGIEVPEIKNLKTSTSGGVLR